ncbi:cytochrome P450 [Serendipita vermifera]|nr:cytochrome P450 [Serendipita vermifera]
MFTNTSTVEIPRVTGLGAIYGMNSTLVISVIVLLLSYVLLSIVRVRTQLPYPPGPRRLPLLGNIRNFPKRSFVPVFTQWKEIYGDIVFAKLLRTPIIIINSLKVADELLTKKASGYSFRPRSVLLHELFGRNWSVAVMQPGPEHSAMRRIFKESIGSHLIVKYDPLIQQTAQKLVTELSGFEGSPLDALQRVTGEVVITLAYGPAVFEAHGQELIDLNITGIKELTHQGSKFWLVEYFPLLKYVPAWTPGATFKRIAAEAFKVHSKIRYWPWAEVNAQYKLGLSGPCIAVDYIEQGQDLDVARDALALMFQGGTDTTSSVLLNFLYAMMIHPGIQEKIQAELDNVIGQGRFPSASDRPQLPYADAAWKESERWIVPVPLGTVRMNNQDDSYEGMRIPKNSKIFPNVSAMLSDPAVFDRPERYIPERWLESYNPLGKSLPDVHIIFGFGMRICPGLHLAERVGFTFGMSVLAAYRIVPIEGESMPDPAKTVYEESTLRRPANFKCAFKPRSSLANAF